MPPKRNPRPGLLAVRSQDLLSVEERRARLGRPAAPCPTTDGVTPPVPTRAPRRSAAASSTSSTVAPPVALAGVPRPTRRLDLPFVRNVRRGGLDRAVSAASGTGMAALIEDLYADREAASARGSSASLMNTWLRFHGIAFGDSLPAFPLTARCLDATSC